MILNFRCSSHFRSLNFRCQNFWWRFDFWCQDFWGTLNLNLRSCSNHNLCRFLILFISFQNSLMLRTCYCRSQIIRMIFYIRHFCYSCGKTSFTLLLFLLLLSLLFAIDHDCLFIEDCDIVDFWDRISLFLKLLESFGSHWI